MALTPFEIRRFRKQGSSRSRVCVKKQTTRLRRRAERLDPESAPVKNRYWNYY